MVKNVHCKVTYHCKGNINCLLSIKTSEPFLVLFMVLFMWVVLARNGREGSDNLCKHQGWGRVLGSGGVDVN